MTETLAIIGAATGVAGFVIASLSFFRDRPKVVVTHSEHTRRHDSYVVVYIANHGRQPIAITAAGLKQVPRTSVGQRLAQVPAWIGEAIFSVLFRAGVSEERLAEWAARIFRSRSRIALLGEIWSAIDEPIVLGLGELRRYKLPAPTPLGTEGGRGGFAIRAYATDSYGRTVLGRYNVSLPDS